MLEVVRGNLPEKIHFLKPRSYTLGRARHNDLCLTEPSISKVARAHRSTRTARFSIEDQGSLHGVYVNAAQGAEGDAAARARRSSSATSPSSSRCSATTASTDQIAEFPWIEQQQLLLSLVQTLNSTLVLSQVLEQVLDAVMRITRAERGFLLLADGRAEAVAATRRWPASGCASAAREGGRSPSPRCRASPPRSCARRCETGETVATGNAVADPSLGTAHERHPHGPAHDRLHPAALPARRGGRRRAAARAWARSTWTTRRPRRPSAPRACGRPRPWPATPRSPSRTPSSSSASSGRSRSCGRRRSSSCSRRSWPPSARWRPASPTSSTRPLTYIMGNLELLQAQSLHRPPEGHARARSPAAPSASRAWPRACSPSAGRARRRCVPLDVNERDRAQPGALPLPDPQGRRAAREGARPATCPQVMGVSNQLEMALINLVVNAIQAMEGRRRRADRRSALRGEDVEIAVGRHRPRHPRRDPGDALRAVRHHQARGQGHGPRPVDRADGRRAPPRPHRLHHQPARARPSASRSPPRAEPRRAPCHDAAVDVEPAPHVRRLS